MTGHTRHSPRGEVSDHVITRLRPILHQGGGALWDTGWGVLMLECSADAAVFDVSHRGIEVARCFLAKTGADEARLWEQAATYPTLPEMRPIKPTSLPWLAVGLLPDGLLLLNSQPQLMMELGEVERCAAWAIMTSAPGIEIG